MPELDIHHPHDSLFKKLMGDKRIAKQFLEVYLPEDLSADIDFSTLSYEDKSFVGKCLEASHADILLMAKYLNKPGYVYFLVQHFSKAIKLAPAETQRHVLSICEQHMRQYADKEFPLVYPIILYAGSRAYWHSTDIFNLFGSQKERAQQISQQPIQLVDVTQIPDNTLLKQSYAGLLQIVLKLAWCEDYEIGLQTLSHFLSQTDLDDDIISTIGYYLFSVWDAQSIDDFFVKLTQYLTKSKGEHIMSIAERLIDRGRKQGMQQTVINLLKKKQTPNFIIDVTGISKTELEQLKKELSTQE